MKGNHYRIGMFRMNVLTSVTFPLTSLMYSLKEKKRREELTAMLFTTPVLYVSQHLMLDSIKIHGFRILIWLIKELIFI